jgi:hypothetical protein
MEAGGSGGGIAQRASGGRSKWDLFFELEVNGIEDEANASA